MQSPNNDDAFWLVSFADDDDRELTADQIAKALAAGEIVLTTIVWRDGMADWKPIVEVPELRTVVQRQRIARKRSTVMGGFGTPAPPPPVRRHSPHPGPSLPYPADPPRPLMRSAGPHAGTPKGSLAGARPPRAFTPTPPPPLEDLGSDVLESVPTNDLSDYRSSPLNEGRTTLTGPEAAFPRSFDPEDDDAEPISLIPESVVPESVVPDSIDSSDLQSLAEQAPPQGKKPGIFPIDVNAGAAGHLGQDGEMIEDALEETTTPATAEDDASTFEEFESAPPAIRVFEPEPPLAKATPSRGPSPPTPPRPAASMAPVPTTSTSESEAPGAKKRGGVGKFILAAAVIGFCAGAFYLGRQTASVTDAVKTASPGGEPTSAQAVVPSAQPHEEETAPDDAPEGSAPEASAAEDEEPPEPEDEQATKDVGVAVAAPRAPRQPSSYVGSSARDPKQDESDSPREPEAEPPEAKKPKTEVEDEDEATPTGPFDRNAAAAALSRAAGAAGSCRSGTDPTGIAQVSVTFSPSGRATRALVEGPPFAGTKTGGCIAARMRGAKIPPFTGSRVVVKKRVVIQ